MYTDLQFGAEALTSLRNGVDKLARAVGATLGPRGKLVAGHRLNRDAFTTKDGATVARHIVLSDHFENMGCGLAKQAAFKTAREAGDGTTTATVVTATMLAECVKYISAGVHPSALKAGIDKALEIAVAEIKATSQEVGIESLRHIATISTNGDEELGAAIAEAVDHAGLHGVVDAMESLDGKTSVETITGLRLATEMLSPVFVTDQERQSCDLKTPVIAFLGYRLQHDRMLEPVFEEHFNAKRPDARRSIVIIADSFDGNVIDAFAHARVKLGCEIIPITTPGIGAHRRGTLEDLAAVCGGRVITSSTTKVRIVDLGSAGEVRATRYFTTFMDGIGTLADINLRFDALKAQLSEAPNQYERNRIEERMNRLAGGVAIVRVGAATQAELGEKMDRVEDGILASKSALEEGIVPGGGSMLIRAAAAIPKDGWEDSEWFGVEAFRKSLDAPILGIASNAGADGTSIANQVRNAEGEHFGYDAKNANFVESMVLAGIVDPAKVARVAIESAVSAVGMLMNAECLVVEVQESPKP